MVRPGVDSLARRQMVWRDGTVRYRADSGRPDVTVAEYKQALTPVKRFRTNGVREHGQGSWFEIIEPAEGVGGEVWAARMALADASALHDQASLREQATRELMRRAGTELREAEQRQDALAVLRELTARRDAAAGRERDELDELVTLAMPGTPLWDLPGFKVNGAEGYDGLGQPAISLGMTAGTGGGLVVVTAPGHDQPHSWLRLRPSVVLTLAEARDRWWIVDADAQNLLSGGSADRGRMERLSQLKFPGSQVMQGHQFIPEAHHVPAGQRE